MAEVTADALAQLLGKVGDAAVRRDRVELLPHQPRECRTQRESCIIRLVSELFGRVGDSAHTYFIKIVFNF